MCMHVLHCNVPVVSLLDNVLQSLIDFFDLVVQSGRGAPIDMGRPLLSSRELFVLECLHSEATQQGTKCFSSSMLLFIKHKEPCFEQLTVY